MGWKLLFSSGWNPRHIEGIEHFFFYNLEFLTNKKFIHGQPVRLGFVIGCLLHNKFQDKFKITTIKIVNILSTNHEKLYLLSDKKIIKEILYKFLLKKKIKITFEKIIFNREINAGVLGKLSFNKFLTYINE